MTVKGYTGKILQIDLTETTSREYDLPEEVARSVVGGKGLGIKLLTELVAPGTEPLSPENAIMYVTGPLTGTSAPSMRGAVVTLSPLTGMFNDSYFGGHFNQELKYAGFDAVIFTGRAEAPTFVSIEDGTVRFHDASKVWGKDTYETYDMVKEALGDSSYRVSCIGPAGENLIRFALVDGEPHRQAGRCGAGAVMGSKNLKAVAVRGTRAVRVTDADAYREAWATACREIAESDDSQELAEFSTASLLPFSNEYGLFPTRNFTDGHYEKGEKLTAEYHDREVWMRDWACAACPIHCGKMGQVRTGKFAGIICDNVEYETLGLLGGNLDIDDVKDLSYFNQVADKLGLDTISLGAVLSFTVEACDRGLIDAADLGGVTPAFGDTESLVKVAEMIAHREGLGAVLADGVERAAEAIGGEARELAIHIQGLETPAWGPRGSYAMGLAYLTGDRGGCHQRGFPIDYEVDGEWDGKSLADGHHREDRAGVTIWEQNNLAALYSLTICEFGRSGISTPTYVDLLSSATGFDFTEEEFYQAGERIWNMIRQFNLSQGWTQERAVMPPRFREELPNGVLSGHAFLEGDEAALLAEYNAARGWDENGVPTGAKLAELDLPTVKVLK